MQIYYLHRIDFGIYFTLVWYLVKFTIDIIKTKKKKIIKKKNKKIKKMTCSIVYTYNKIIN